MEFMKQFTVRITGFKMESLKCLFTEKKRTKNNKTHKINNKLSHAIFIQNDSMANLFIASGIIGLFWFTNFILQQNHSQT